MPPQMYPTGVRCRHDRTTLKELEYAGELAKCGQTHTPQGTSKFGNDPASNSYGLTRTGKALSCFVNPYEE